MNSAVNKVLLIEDNPSDARLIREYLSEAKGSVYELIHADRLSAGLEHLAKDNMDVVLADLGLPDSQGLDTLRELIDKNTKAPIVVLTGLDNETLAIAAVQQGAQDYLVKGQLDSALLARTLRYAIERKRAEETLRALSTRQEAILAAVPDIIMEVDKEKFYTWANPAGLEFFGEDVIGKEAAFYFEGEQATYEQVKPLFKGSENVIYVESWQRRKDGEKRLLAWQCRVLKDTDGNVVGALSSAHDITERKQAEKLQVAIYRIAQAADQAESLDSLYPSIHAIIQEVMVADNFYIALYDEKNDLLSFPYFVDEVDSPDAPKKPGKGLTEYVLRTAKSLLCDDALFEELKQRGEIELVGDHSPIWLGVPLIIAGKAIGVMAIQDYKNAQAYGEREQRILEFVSSQAAMAIHRKRAEQTLKTNEKRFRDIADLTQEWIWEVDAEGKYKYTSQVVEKILGYTPEEILQKHFYELFHPDDRESLKAAALASFAAKQPFREFINRNVHKNGQTVWFVTSGLPLLDDKGNLLGYRGVDTDITARKRAEEALVTERSLLRTLIDHLPDAIYVKDAACRKTLANPVDVRNMGASSEAEVLGKNDFDFFSHDLAAAFYADDQSVIQSGRPILNREEMVTLPDRTIGWQATSKVPVRDSSGQVIGLVGIGHDITARKRAESQLNEQIAELQRWHNATLGRESRILDLKREVNELLAQTGQPPRYPSAEMENP